MEDNPSLSRSPMSVFFYVFPSVYYNGGGGGGGGDDGNDGGDGGCTGTWSLSLGV